jgi:hypothetical protein
MWHYTYVILLARAMQESFVLSFFAFEMSAFMSTKHDFIELRVHRDRRHYKKYRLSFIVPFPIVIGQPDKKLARSG